MASILLDMKLICILPILLAVAGVINAQQAQPNFPVTGMGTWQIIATEPGVSCMHMNLLPNNKVIMYDAQATHMSQIKNPNNECIRYNDENGATGDDCQAHGVEFDLATNKVRPLKFMTDGWCSSGGLLPDGRFVSTGGFFSGYQAARYLTACPDGTCQFKEYPRVLADNRWYATQINLGDGRTFIIGGRMSYNFEYLAPEGKDNPQLYQLPWLDEATDMFENSLYPFVYQMSDGNIYVFANNRSIILSPKTNKVVKELPQLPGGGRNYPASAMSALLPIDLKEQNPPVIPNDVIICGGNTQNAFPQAEQRPQVFLPAFDDCNTMRITDPNPVWDKETMPSKRVMGDMVILPTGDLLLINGAQKGASAWWDGEDPNLQPLIYNPKMPKGQRFFKMTPTNIPRMYHSVAAVLPNGKIIVAGSNPNPTYRFDVKYVTELRVEAFTPPYMDKTLDVHRPVITAHEMKLKYGVTFPVTVKINEADKPTIADVKVTLYSVPFTTHGYSMNQRLLNLFNKDFKPEGAGAYRITVLSPPGGNIAPPGMYLLNVVHRGVPSTGVWVQLQL